MHLGVGGIDRDVQVPGIGVHEPGGVFLVEGGAVGRDTGVNAVLMTELHQVEEARLDEGLSPAEADREGADEVLDAQEGILPLLDAHLVLVVGKPPVLTVAAFHIAPLVHQTIERDRASHVLADVEIEFFGKVIVSMF